MSDTDMHLTRGAPRQKLRPPEHDEPRAAAKSGRLKRKRIDQHGALEFDKRYVPDGMSYEWKRISVYGKPDPRHLHNLRQNHWTAVPASRHPEFAESALNDTIVIDGQMLMERPDYLTKEAILEDYNIARERVDTIQVRQGETPNGTLPRDHPSAKRVSSITSRSEPMEIPED